MISPLPPVRSRTIYFPSDVTTRLTIKQVIQHLKGVLDSFKKTLSPTGDEQAKRLIDLYERELAIVRKNDASGIDVEQTVLTLVNNIYHGVLWVKPPQIEIIKPSESESAPTDTYETADSQTDNIFLNNPHLINPRLSVEYTHAIQNDSYHLSSHWKPRVIADEVPTGYFRTTSSMDENIERYWALNSFDVSHPLTNEPLTLAVWEEENVVKFQLAAVDHPDMEVMTLRKQSTTSARRFLLDKRSGHLFIVTKRGGPFSLKLVDDAQYLEQAQKQIRDSWHFPEAIAPAIGMIKKAAYLFGPSAHSISGRSTENGATLHALLQGGIPDYFYILEAEYLSGKDPEEAISEDKGLPPKTRDRLLSALEEMADHRLEIIRKAREKTIRRSRYPLSELTPLKGLDRMRNRHLQTVTRARVNPFSDMVLGMFIREIDFWLELKDICLDRVGHPLFPYGEKEVQEAFANLF